MPLIFALVFFNIVKITVICFERPLTLLSLIFEGYQFKVRFR
jgi:hypothetical protein